MLSQTNSLLLLLFFFGSKLTGLFFTALNSERDLNSQGIHKGEQPIGMNCTNIYQDLL